MYLFTITRGLATHEIIAASKSDALAESRRVYADQYGAPIPIGRVVELGRESASRAIGATYEVEVQRDDGAFAGARVAGAKWVAAAADDDELVARWVAHDAAAYTADTARRRAERAKADAVERFGELTLDEVARMLANAGPQRYALLANVLRRIGA